MAARKTIAKAAAKTAAEETRKETVKEQAQEKAVKAEAPKAEPVKAEPVKAEAVKPETAKPEKKEAAKKETKRAAVLKETVYVQYLGKEINTAELTKKVKNVWTKQLKNKVGDMKTVVLYVKPEENRAYYVVNDDVTGYVEM